MMRERMVMSQVSREFLGRAPSEGPWLGAGKHSRVSHSKGKAGLLREMHIPTGRVRSVSGGESGPGRNTLHRESVDCLGR